MSSIKLKKSYNKPIKQPTGSKKFIPVVFGDSIGKRLEQKVLQPLHKELKFWCEGGRTTTKAVTWIDDNLETEIQLLDNHNKILLYVQVGICDLLTLDKSTGYNTLKYIKTEEAVKDIKANYKKIINKLHEVSPESKVTILPITFASIEIWNKHKKHKNPEIFRENDHTLEEQILAINKQITEINKDNGTKAPDLNVDLYRTSKRQKKSYKGQPKPERHGDTKPRKYYNVSLLYDGIHPEPAVAGAWLAKITQLAIKNCWEEESTTTSSETDENNNS